MERPSSFCSRVVLKIFLTAGGAGAAFSAQNASGIGKAERAPSGDRGQLSRGAEPSCGFAARRCRRAGREYMLPLPVWNTGSLCGNACCRLVAGAEPYVSRNAASTVPRQSLPHKKLARAGKKNYFQLVNICFLTDGACRRKTLCRNCRQLP